MSIPSQHALPNRSTFPHEETAPVSREPATEAKQPSDRHHGNAIAFLCSFVFHTALLLILACCVYTAGKKSRGVLINARVDQSQSFALDDVEVFELSMDTAAAEPRVEVQTDFRMDVDLESPESQDLGEKTTLTSVSVDQAIDNLREKTKGRGANFFGTYAEGNRFVYVLDSSLSMTGDRWLYACQQLLDSLKGLRKNQEFYVICFDHETTFLFDASPDKVKYIQPSDRNIERVKNYLRSKKLGKLTMPAIALQYALRLNPDAIFLLSDGELQDNSRFILRKTNSNVSESRQIPIHTVHLFSEFGRETLELIADENQGTFTAVEGSRRFGRIRRR